MTYVLFGIKLDSPKTGEELHSGLMKTVVGLRDCHCFRLFVRYTSDQKKLYKIGLNTDHPFPSKLEICILYPRAASPVSEIELGTTYTGLIYGRSYLIVPSINIESEMVFHYHRDLSKMYEHMLNLNG